MRKMLLCIVLVLLLFIVSACMTRQQGFEHNLENLLNDYNYTDDELIEYLKERGSLDIYYDYEDLHGDLYKVYDDISTIEFIIDEEYSNLYDRFSDYFNRINKICKNYFPDGL